MIRLRRLAAASGVRAWLLFVAGGVLASLAYVFLPLGGPLRALIYAGAPVLASGMLFLAAGRAGSVKARNIFLLQAAAMCFTAVGSTIYQTALLGGHFPASGSLNDLFWLAFYPPLLLSLLRLIRRQDGSYLGVLDGGVLAATLMIPVLAFFVEPYIASNASTRTVVVQSLYAFGDVLVLSALIRLTLARARSSVGLRLFMVSIGAYISSDFVWNWLTHVAHYTPGSWADAGWILSGALVAAGIVHPASLPSTSMAVPRANRQRRPLLVLTAACLAVFPIVVLLPGNHGQPTSTVVGLAALAQVVLMAARLRLLLRENARASASAATLTGQLQQAHKMEAVGQLAAGIAHDFNNLLQVISGYSSLLRHRLETQNVEATGLDEVMGAAHRAAVLTQQLLAFARKQTFQLTTTEIAALLEETTKINRPLLDANITFSVTADPRTGSATIDRGQIQQALTTLILNAQDAMPSGGTLDIRATRVEIDQPHAQLAEVAPGSYIAITVTDTGTGMDANTTARLFEPFFTTKPFGTSSGLGLSTTYGIIRQSSGFIDVTSTPNSGSSFTIYLPTTQQTDSTHTTRNSGASAPRPPRRTLGSGA